jgi:sensor histidine kinase YesM
LAEGTASLKKYIALYCPNIQNVQIYIPAENGCEVHYSGWENSPIRDDEGLTYPAYRLNPDSIGENPVYLRIQSCYSHNYTLEFYTQKEFNQVRTLDFCSDSFLFGMLITIVLLNWITFYKLKNKTCLAFSMCILLLSIHQGISYGIYNIIMPAHSYVIMNLSIEIGLLFIISIIVLFIVFSGIKVYSKLYYRCLLLFIAACLIDYPICLIDRVTANLYGHLLTIAVSLFILYVSFRLHRAGHKDQRVFIIGLILTIALCAMAMAICEGLVRISFLPYHLPASLITMVIISIIFSISLTEHARQLQLEDLQIRRRYQAASDQVKKTETALMQTQIKPHFLYNTLTAIEQMCEIDSQKAQAAIADFSNYLRSNVDFSTETKLIMVEKELENVRQYLSLEQMRFEERLNVIYDIKSGGFMMPPLVVQPIVENAVRHGVTKKPEGGTVTIAVGETKTAYRITVSDNGVGFHPEGTYQNGGSHIGIRNARGRLARMCRGTLEIQSQTGIGTTAVITIPKELADEPDSG